MSLPYDQTRCSTQDRERVIERLGKALAAGQLTAEEYDERLTVAAAAKTQGDLRPLTQDLPGSLW